MKDYDSMDNFVLNNNSNDIANMFNGGKYKKWALEDKVKIVK